MQKSTKKEVESPKDAKVILTFQEIGKTPIPLKYALAMPVVQIALERFVEGKKMRFDYREETTKEAVFTYLSIKKAQVDETDMPDLSKVTAETWTHVFSLACHFGDMAFFEDESIQFPELDDVVDEVPNMVQEAMMFYIEWYLSDAFYPDCECEHGKVRDMKEDAEAWWDTLPEATRKIYSATISAPDLPMKWVGHYPNETHMLLVDKNEYFRSSFEYYNRDDIASGEIYNWYGLDTEIRQYLISKFHTKVPKCECVCSFHTVWTNFNTMHPSLAEFIWTNMDRENLLEIANCPRKKVNTMKRSSFGDMTAYVAKFKPKEYTSDPHENKLKAAVARAKRGTRVGAFGRYINSEEIAIAECKLQKYQMERKRNRQRQEAKDSVAKWKETRYTTPGFAQNFQINTLKLKGRRVRK